MRIHRLEISGFKSFPDRSELLFDQGVTAIVGPNGCGKSNVVDAITWVLGEQSARSLRGDRMEDVIFGGSDARKPTAAAEVRLFLAGVTASARYGASNGGLNRREPGDSNCADGSGTGNGNGNGHAVHATAVTDATTRSHVLTLDEVDEEAIAREVQVSRRLYRSGESEYLIDGSVCRLRDVQDLLMDAGVGVKGYAVIEQGKIGQILSARPADRRQLIEEAAGVTKYKSRRRAAELKLEAAQHNLVRIDDIVFEVDKQRLALKRQAGRARRYRRLREELRTWEKIAFARRYHALAAAIQSARERVADAHARDAAAAAHLLDLENGLERRRIELAEADARAAAARETAHARELEIGRRQQQIELDRQQVELLATSAEGLKIEVEMLRRRRGPAGDELDQVREDSAKSARDLTAATSELSQAERAFTDVHQRIEGLEADVEAARNEVFAALNAATALRHAIDHASIVRERLAGTLEKLELERSELQLERDNTAKQLADIAGERQRVGTALEETAQERQKCEAWLASARHERDRHGRELRDLEHQLAGMAARLHSLEELEASRAGYGDAARLVLAESHGAVRHLGSLADHLEVDPAFERAVEAYLGDLLQHVVVPGASEAAAGLDLVRRQGAGRCGFIVASGNAAPALEPPSANAGDRLTPLQDAIRVEGPAERAIREVIGHAWIAESFEQAAAVAGRGPHASVTLDGVVFRGRRLIQGGGRDEAIGILAIKREVKALRTQVQSSEAALEERVVRATEIDASIARIEQDLATLTLRQHDGEKTVVGLELHLARTSDEAIRVARKYDLVEIERRGAEEERRSLLAREAEARDAIGRLETEQRSADEQLTGAQRRLFEARDAAADLSRRAAEAKATHAALVERAAAQAADLRRLEEALQDLESRIAARRDEISRNEAKREALQSAVTEGRTALDTDLQTFEVLRAAIRTAECQVTELQESVTGQEAAIRDARRAVDSVRSEMSELEVARATAEADLAHLAASCAEALDATLDQVAREASALEEGVLTRPAVSAIEEIDSDDLEERAPRQEERATRDEEWEATPDEAMARLRDKINRLGPVNMMAIEQFDELEQRHEFLTTQRKDLVDSIAATAEAIKRIDRTTRERFGTAFAAINEHLQETFTTLFGGGRAGLVLLDESDLLETGIDIIAQPPGKRLQNVQLLSGGEKALTAMALMFAIFKYRPSPFCLLDEIDAPLDDANIGRFITMLRGMQDHTQFILITHNRKTMEIADRLYGITMEEPGVSKLISLRLN